MKRVLCIVGGMNAGGAETYLMKIYREIDKSKYQMDFAVAIKDEGYYDNEIKRMGGKIHKITPKSQGFFRNYKDIKLIVKENKYEAVLRTSQHALSAMELLAAKKGGAKTRIFRSSNSNTVSASKLSRITHKLCAFMPKRFANVKIAPSTEAAKFMFGKRAVRKGEVTILHNGVDLNVFRFDEQGRENVRKEFGIQKDQYVIGHIGRFMTQKNHLFLLDIFYQIYTQNNKAVLLLVGKGELQAQIQEKIKTLGIEKNVIFAGVRSDVPQLLSAMDVFVFPSLYEGMPNTVIEAQATGLPCVIADTITKEADITGLVQYLSLQVPCGKWASVALNAISKERKNTKNDFINNKYDIESVANEFIQLVFNEQ